MSKCTIHLKGKAKEIWKKIPKGAKSTVISNLLIQAYEKGNLELWILEEETEKKEENRYKEKVKDKEQNQVSSSGNFGGGLEEPKRKTLKRSLREPEDKKLNRENRTRKKEAPEWIQDIESKIVKDHVELVEHEKGQESEERRKEAEVQGDRGDNQESKKKEDPGWLKNLESKMTRLTKVKEKINRFNF